MWPYLLQFLELANLTRILLKIKIRRKMARIRSPRRGEIIAKIPTARRIIEEIKALLSKVRNRIWGTSERIIFNYQTSNLAIRLYWTQTLWWACYQALHLIWTNLKDSHILRSMASNLSLSSFSLSIRHCKTNRHHSKWVSILMEVPYFPNILPLKECLTCSSRTSTLPQLNTM